MNIPTYIVHLFEDIPSATDIPSQLHQFPSGETNFFMHSFEYYEDWPSKIIHRNTFCTSQEHSLSPLQRQTI